MSGRHAEVPARVRGPGASRAPDDGVPRRRGSAGGAVVGVIGEILITLGVLLGLFVVWQLWWTDVTAGRVQDQVVEDLGWVAPEPAPTPERTEEPAERTDEPPVIDEPADVTTFGVLSVPRWGPDYARPITQGVSRPEVLDTLGIGHYPGTVMPGDVGNFALAGHRTTYNKPFNQVAELEDDDPLVVWVEESDTWYVYRVTETRIVLPHEVEVIAPVPGEPGAEPEDRMITLTTCHPMFSARERFIVHGELDYWMPAADGTPDELTEGA